MTKRADRREFHVIYKIMRFDGMYYIGKHSTDNLDDAYLGSGTRISRSIAKYGVLAHTKIILEMLPSRAELNIREREIVNDELLRDPLCMNLKVGGDGGWDHIDQRGDRNPMRRPDVVEKVRLANKNPSDDLRKLRSDNMKRTRSEMVIQPRLGVKHTEKSKQLMSENRTGKGGWNKGLKLGPDSEETIEKKRLAGIRRVQNGQDMGALSRGKTKNMKHVTCPHCGKDGRGPNMTRFHFDKCKHSPKD